MWRNNHCLLWGSWWNIQTYAGKHAEFFRHGHKMWKVIVMLVMFVHPSLLLHGRTLLPLDGFSWNLIFEFFQDLLRNLTLCVLCISSNYVNKTNKLHSLYIYLFYNLYSHSTHLEQLYRSSSEVNENSWWWTIWSFETCRVDYKYV